MTERGWEAEFAIPLKTLRYSAGQERTWGINAMRNIRSQRTSRCSSRRCPRGLRPAPVSVAGKLHGVSLPARRDLESSCRMRPAR